MLYDDTRNAPKTAEDHEKDAYGSTCLTGECLDVLSGVVDEAVHYVEAAREHIAQRKEGIQRTLDAPACNRFPEN